jgi:hypothetical protein
VRSDAATHGRCRAWINDPAAHGSARIAWNASGLRGELKAYVLSQSNPSVCDNCSQLYAG